MIDGATGDSAKPDDITKLIQVVKDEHNKKYPDIKKYMEEYDPAKHKVMDETIRKNKQLKGPTKKVSVPENPNDPNSRMVPREEPGENGKIEPVNRIAIPFQKKIVETRVNFAFGKPITLEVKGDRDETNKESEEKYLDIVNKIFKKNKIDTINREYAREAHRATRVAECWYLAPGETNTEYGGELKGKIRVVVWKPWEGDNLYPFYDDYNDMIAFGREYRTKDIEGKEETHFELYTVDAKSHFNLTDGTGGWAKKEVAKNPYGKIPIVYTEFDEPAWCSVQSMIERMEAMLSDLGDTNQYHADPKIVTQGKILSMMEKGEKGGILQLEKDAKAQYMAWDNASESQKVEAEMLLRFIYSMTNTPDMSFEQMSKMTNPSGETMKMLFMDALLQVLSDSEKWNDWQERRQNLLKTIIYKLIKGAEGTGEFPIEPKINPFIIEDFTSKVANLSTASGGAQLMSQETAITMLGAVEDVAAELEKINKETDANDQRAIKKEQAMQTSSEF